ncbi:MAG: cyclic pyranopterin monophosphate synthase MoaC [Desulfuromonadales bacterium]|jgi:cyclic pyranopterin phosphate synthase
MSFSHFDTDGRAIMVDISAKQPTLRTAIAEAKVRMLPTTLVRIQNQGINKGDVFNVSRLAGISAAKKTPDLIPLSHPLMLNAVSIDFEIDKSESTILVRSKVVAVERTGVEMEAMVAASTAALTIYDMCKAVDRDITICEMHLVYKEGGKSGIYKRT